MRPSGIAILPDGSKAYVADHVALPGAAVYIVDMTTPQFTVSSTMLSVSSYPQSIAVTPDGSQVWVAQWGGWRVDVFDTLTNDFVYGFAVPAANGIAFNPSGTRAYMVSGANNTVIVADTSSYQVVAQIPVGTLPHSVLVSKTGRHVFVTNVLSHSISLIDAGSNTVLRTINLRAQHPLGLAFVAKSPFCACRPREWVTGRRAASVTTASNSFLPHQRLPDSIPTGCPFQMLSVGKERNSLSLELSSPIPPD